MKEQAGERRSRPGIRALLEAADPLRHESPLSTSDIERMRQTVLRTERAGTGPAWLWPRAFAAAALVVLLVIAGTVNRGKTRRIQPGEATKVAAPSGPAERRQLQFETPGGTRIIWTIDPAFKLEGVAP
jgi:hypothetical protein